MLDLVVGAGLLDVVVRQAGGGGSDRRHGATPAGNAPSLAAKSPIASFQRLSSGALLTPPDESGDGPEKRSASRFDVGLQPAVRPMKAAAVIDPLADSSQSGVQFVESSATLCGRFAPVLREPGTTVAADHGASS